MNLALLAAGSFGLVAASAGALLVEARSRERRDRRLASVLGPRRIGLVQERRRPAAGFVRAERVQAVLGLRAERAPELPVRWWAVPAALLVLLAVLVFILDAGAVGLLLALPGAALTSRAVFAWFEERRCAALRRQLPDTLAMIVRAVRVGLPVVEAMRVVAREAPAPTRVEFGQVSDRIAIGHSLEDALAGLAHSSGLQEYRFFNTALVLQNQTGGSLAEALDNLSDVIRRRAALRARARALASEARTSALILGAMPAVGGAALAFISPDYIRPLVEDPTGRILGIAAIGMLLCGALVMRAIVRRSLG